MTRPPVRWIPDDGSGAVLRRALLLLARADGVTNGHGRIVPQQRRRP